MTEMKEFKIAAIQASPFFFDPDASAEKACGLIAKAGRSGAVLAAFGETWLPGYPFFAEFPDIDRARTVYLANAVEIPGPVTSRLCDAAKKAGIDVAIGVAERDSRTRGTVYCTLLFIGCEGRILGRHRKLKPTDEERRVWGEGDGTGLAVYERPYGRISGLNCWEHKMVLPGYALMAEGTQVHVAAWPFAKTLDPEKGSGALLSRAFAAQGSCYVAATCSLLIPDNVPAAYRDAAVAFNKKYRERRGGARIIDPAGRDIATAPADEETVLTATVSLEVLLRHKARADVGGHYSRPDVLRLLINRRQLSRVVESDIIGERG
jgi:nitrilase